MDSFSVNALVWVLASFPITWGLVELIKHTIPDGYARIRAKIVEHEEGLASGAHSLADKAHERINALEAKIESLVK
jgi:hypothetical protein